MKCLRDKFKQKVDFVKPLYKKVRNDNRVKPLKKLFVSVNVTNDTKLYGDGVYVKRKIIKDNFDCKNAFVVKDFSDSADRTLSGVNRNQRNVHKPSDLKFKPKRNAFSETFKHKNNNVKRTVDSNMERVENNTKFIQAAKVPLADKIRDTWLRVYPAPQAHGECALSVIMRCLVCQIGLASFLVLWTVAWVFVIHYYEGPYETAVSEQLESEQNELVINLATELRQITPLSPKWKSAIEKRIEDERKLTMEAVERGAKLLPGQFWNLSGTFLFTVYVMTALGFGAPVPQTVLGRTCGLIYAGLSVPTHIYLMVNASTCVVVYVEGNLDKFKSCFQIKKHHIKSTDETGNPNSSRNPKFMKKPCQSILSRKITCLVNVLSCGRCVPLATVLYYAVGALCFGLVRERKPLEVFLFPLEFTTTGGLEQVEPHVRILYGVYIEGAMALLACALATLRRHSSATINTMSEKYRLFSTEPIS